VEFIIVSKFFGDELVEKGGIRGARRKVVFISSRILCGNLGAQTSIG